MKTRISLFLLLCFGIQTLSAQTDSLPEKNPGTFFVQLKQDNALGFYPAVFGSVGINAELDFTFYAIFWTNPTFGTASAGTNLWTETGIGLGLPALEGKLYFNPAVGFTHGNLQSGNTQGVIGEGIAPNLTVFYLDDRFEAEGFFIYYKNLRSDNPDPADYIIYWLYPGVRFSPTFSLGFHYERFLLVDPLPGLEEIRYNWTGLYLKATVLGKHQLQFAAGLNNGASIYSEEFYKITANVSLH